MNDSIFRIKDAFFRGRISFGTALRTMAAEGASAQDLCDFAVVAHDHRKQRVRTVRDKVQEKLRGLGLA